MAHPWTGRNRQWGRPEHAGNGGPPRRGRVAAHPATPPHRRHATPCKSDAATRQWPTPRTTGAMHPTHGGAACGATGPDGAVGRGGMRACQGQRTLADPPPWKDACRSTQQGRLGRPHSGQMPSVPDGHTRPTVLTVRSAPEDTDSPPTPTAQDLTPKLTCCWKRERRRSGRCKQSGAVRGSARMCAWTSGLPSAAVWEPHDPRPSSPLARGDDPTCCDGHASWDGLVKSQFLRTLLARHAPPLPVSLRSAVVYGATMWTAAQ